MLVARHRRRWLVGRGRWSSGADVDLSLPLQRIMNSSRFIVGLVDWRGVAMVSRSLLPMAITLLLSLLITTEALAILPGRHLFRTSTPFRASGSSDDDDATAKNNNNNKSPNTFERMVRTVSKNKDYQFGDLTKKVVDATTHGVEESVRTVSKNKDYRFGDLTKKVVDATTHGVEEVIDDLTDLTKQGVKKAVQFEESIVRSVTHNEDYHFGDFAKGTIGAAGSAMTYVEKSLEAFHDGDIHDFIELMNMYYNNHMGEIERIEAFTVVVYTGAIMILAYNFIANLMSGVVLAAAWTKVVMEAVAGTTSTPLISVDMMLWTKVFHVQSIMEKVFGGPCLPARALITIPFFFQYRKFVVGMARYSPLRAKFPIITRYSSLILSWVVANIVFVGGFTLFMMKIGALLTTGVSIPMKVLLHPM